MTHEIFISYAAEDKDIADAVCEAIEAEQIKCWYAPRDVEYGQDFEESIVDAICASRLIILILTSHSNTSAHVKREIQNACMEEVNVPVLPFRVEDVPLNKALRYYIGSVHWLDAVTSPLDPHLQRLVEHVRARLPRSAPPPPPPPPQPEPKIQPELTAPVPETPAAQSTPVVDQTADIEPAVEETRIAESPTEINKPVAKQPARGRDRLHPFGPRTRRRAISNEGPFGEVPQKKVQPTGDARTQTEGGVIAGAADYGPHEPAIGQSKKETSSPRKIDRGVKIAIALAILVVGILLIARFNSVPAPPTPIISSSDTPRTPSPTPTPLPSLSSSTSTSTRSLLGTSWDWEDSNGNHYSYEYLGDGKLRATNKKTNAVLTGAWKQAGNAVTATFGIAVENGTLDGFNMSGTSGSSMTWKATEESASRLRNGGLLGTIWKGTDSDDSFVRIYEFLPSGRLKMKSGNDPYEGTWAQSGSSVTITMPSYRREGQIRGDSIDGSIFYPDGRKATWSVKRQ